jgi:ATP adenylyltransferase
MGELYYLGNARNQVQYDEMVELEAKGICLFCPEGLVVRDKKVIRDNGEWNLTYNDHPYPNTLHHLLLLPLRHVTDFTNLFTRELASLLQLVEFAKVKFQFEAYGIAIRNGEPSLTGGTIRHLHVHLIVGNPNTDDPVRVKLSSKPK